ncbi:cold shock domain-containing protein [Litoribacillus peritrichatus]|uniref:CSD domain-containing protein n=1 Tax=Litoribacillus peritrichatus TaxID=718191 RepID=A0ABP7N8P3_9GAMM
MSNSDSSKNIIKTLVTSIVAPLVGGGALSVAGLLPETITVETMLIGYVVLAVATLVVQLIVSSVTDKAEGGDAASSRYVTEQEDVRETGTVKWFNVSKGFGFITRDQGEDIFVHFRSIRGRGHRFLKEGQKVKFDVIKGDKGLQADDVAILKQ